MSREFRLVEHTADVAVEARGDTLGEAFAACADGLTAAQCEDVPASGQQFAVTAHAESREAALLEYLDELVYQRDVRGVLPADHEAKVHFREEWVVEAYARGVPLEAVDAREVKAVTYSEMRLEKGVSGWEAYVVFDV